MTLEEAVVVVETSATADGGCSYCFESLMELFRKSIPEAPWDEAMAKFDENEKQRRAEFNKSQAKSKRQSK